MPGELTEVTELSTALGTLTDDLDEVFHRPDPPHELRNVDDPTWARLGAGWRLGSHRQAFLAAHANGQAMLRADDGLRGRRPLRVEWQGPRRTPGDDTIPTDLRIDHVYLVSCKYLSKVLLNASPSRLFERALAGDERSSSNWFDLVAPEQYQAFYAAAVNHLSIDQLPARASDLDRQHQEQLKSALSGRTLPELLHTEWQELCQAVATESAARWSRSIGNERHQLRLLWRLLRIAAATYFVLGTQPGRMREGPSVLRLRVDSAWDWSQHNRLVEFDVAPRSAGQPVVDWSALVERPDGSATAVAGHVEVRWSHGRFLGSPEAKVYLDTPHRAVPGYHLLT